MSQYTMEVLQDKLDKNINWRKRELTLIKNNIDSSEGIMLKAYIRTGILILYAHWEGFIKISAREYIKFLNDQKISCSDMTDNFVTLSVKSIICDAGKSNKSSKHFEVVNKLLNNSDRIFKVKEKEKLIVDTESNLSYNVLAEILFGLGFDNSKYVLKQNFIKENLIDQRNAIAHGELIKLIPDTEDDIKHIKEEYSNLFHEILKLMDLFKEQILDAVVNKRYLKK